MFLKDITNKLSRAGKLASGLPLEALRVWTV
jgi:hypothetical protein